MKKNNNNTQIINFLVAQWNVGHVGVHEQEAVFGRLCCWKKGIQTARNSITPIKWGTHKAKYNDKTQFYFFLQTER